MKYINRYGIFESKNSKNKLPVKKIEYDGYTIYYGKSAAANEEVTFNIAEPNDIWLHVKGVPGSHVVIKNNSKQIDENIINYAAKIATINSKSNSSKQAVVWTLAKNVYKKPTMDLGEVGVSDTKTIFVNKNELDI